MDWADHRPVTDSAARAGHGRVGESLFIDRRLSLGKRDFKRRKAACEMAALVLSGDRSEVPDMPRLWSLAVFFDMYLEGGSSATRKDFGHRKPVKLRPAEPKPAA